MPLVRNFQLNAQQLRFFETFGFLSVPQLFRDEVEGISDAFDDRFAQTPSSDPDHDLDNEGFDQAFASRDRIDSYHHLNFGDHRAIIPRFVETTPGLDWLLTDYRVQGVVSSLLGPAFDYRGSDGNVLECSTAWHCDIYDAPLDGYNLKLFFYLDELIGDAGAIKMIPGTNDYQSDFAERLRRDLDNWENIDDLFGVKFDEIPSWTLPSRPGDLLMGNFRTVHATFNGRDRRRLFTMNFRQAEPAA